MSGMIRRFGKGMKRTFEFMEQEVEPLIDMAGGDIEMGILGEEALVTVEALAAVAAVPIAVLESPVVAVAGGVAMLLGLGEFFPVKRKRSPTGVIIRSAGGTSRALPSPSRPRVPGPVPEMPARKKVSKKVKARKGPKAKTQKSKRTVKKTTSSKKKPKKSPTYTASIKQEVHGKFRRKDVSYFGFQATGGMAELFGVAADSILRAVLKRHHVGVRSTDVAVSVQSTVPAMSQVVIGYRRTKYDDGTDGGNADGTVINFASGTYESKVTALGSELSAKCRAGYYPVKATSKNSSGTNILTIRKLGDAKLNVKCTRSIKLRNITKNDDAGDTLNSLDTNPIQGRLYKFRHDTPRVTPTLYETDVGSFSKFHDRLCTAGVIFGPQRNASGDNDGAPPTNPGIMSLDKVLSSPPPGGRIWDNLSSSKKIAMAPGQAALHKMSFKYSGTVRQFLAKFATSAYETPSIGYCHLFGFEQKFKTDANDEVNVEYDCDDVLKASCSFVRDDIAPPTVRTLHSHSSAY